MAAHDPKEGAREKAGWGLPVPAPAGTRATERVIDELFAAPKGEAVDADPVASLFQDSRALPAPAIADVQSEAEITRWRAAGKAVVVRRERAGPGAIGCEHDAVGAHAQSRERAERPATGSARRAQGRAAAFACVSGTAPELRGGASSPPMQVSQAPISLSMAPLERVSSAPAEGATRKRRVETGPKKGVLAGLGVAAALTLGSAAVVLRLIPNPVAPAPQAAAVAAPAPKPAAPAIPAAPPMAVPVHGFKPAPVPAPPPAEVAAAEAAPTPVVAADTVAVEAPSVAPAAVAAPLAAKSKVPVTPAAAPTAALAKVEAPKTGAPNDAAESSAGGEQNQRLVSAATKKLAEDDPKGAEALMREALTNDPDDHHAMEVLVRALIDQDRGAEAVPFARRMVKRRSRRVPYRLLLGDALLMTGDENGARREWKAALEIEPKRSPGPDAPRPHYGADCSRFLGAAGVLA